MRVKVPAGVIAVKPMPKPGWTLDIVKAPYGKTYSYFHNAKLTEGVAEISWSGGKLLDAALVIELPPGVEYVPGSASGGLTPVDPSFGSSQAVADGLSRGALARQERSDVRWLVWRTDLIPTAAAVAPFRFSYQAKPGASGTIRADLFKNANELFQTERIAVGALR